MEDLTGKQLGSYQIVAPLGEGGMAVVYKAYQLGKVNRHVALKVLPQVLARDAEFAARFEHEANILANLRHPRILPAFDFGCSEGYSYIVMPFVESGTLADLLRGRPLPLPQVDRIVGQVADALDYAHSRGVVHRDVKPSNILVDERGDCLLTDFGVSKIVESSLQLTKTGGLLGTPAYMSPEQAHGEALDGRSDLYSLGIVLFEMTTGRVPFKAETPVALILKHVQTPLPPPRAFNPDLPPAVEQVIVRALAKRPDDRYGSAGEMAGALHAAIPDATWGHPDVTAPVAAMVEVPPDDLQELMPRPPVPEGPSMLWTAGKIALAVVAGVVLIGLGILAVAGLILSTSPHQRTAFPRPTVAPTAVPTATATRTVVVLDPLVKDDKLHRPPVVLVDPRTAWAATGGARWSRDADAIHGESVSYDGVYLNAPVVSDFTFSADLSTTDREASLAIRMQDSGDGYLVILIPVGAVGATPGLFLAERSGGRYTFPASVPVLSSLTIGQWARLSVQGIGPTIRASLDGHPMLDFTDNVPPIFTAGRLGFRVYGDPAAPCHASFRNIELQ